MSGKSYGITLAHKHAFLLVSSLCLAIVLVCCSDEPLSGDTPVDVAPVDVADSSPTDAVDGDIPAGEVASIEATAATTFLEVGDTVQLEATCPSPRLIHLSF